MIRERMEDGVSECVHQCEIEEISIERGEASEREREEGEKEKKRGGKSHL